MNSASMAEPGHSSSPSIGEEGKGPKGLSLENVSWQLSYDRASVERFVADVEATRSSLEAEIDDAKRRLLQAQEAKTERRSDLPAELGALVLAAQREFVELERSHLEMVNSIKEAASLEAMRILETARLETTQLREAVDRWRPDR